MHIPPARRRRILKVHHLRQQGNPLRKIAEQLNISHATLLREARHTVAAVQSRAEQRPEQEVDLPGLTNANHSNQRISQPAQEIVDPGLSEKTSLTTLTTLTTRSPTTSLKKPKPSSNSVANRNSTPHAFADAAGG